jgi:hypothetical protein
MRRARDTPFEESLQRSMKQELPICLPGRFASAHHGTARSTQDIDIAKLEWAKLAKSHRQIEDVVAILKIKGEALDQSYVEKWVSELGLQPHWSIAKRARALPESDG